MKLDRPIFLLLTKLIRPSISLNSGRIFDFYLKIFFSKKIRWYLGLRWLGSKTGKMESRTVLVGPGFGPWIPGCKLVMRVSLERWKSVFYSGACIRLNIIKLLLISLKQRNGKYRTLFLLEIKLLMGKWTYWKFLKALDF